MSTIKPVFRFIDNQFKALFSSSRCLLTISVGQEAHEGEKFAATIDLINHSFTSCVVSVCDSLQRHSFALSTTKSADYYYQSAIDAGSEWMQRNRKYLKNFSIPNKVIRWNHWLHHYDYYKAHKEVINMREKEPLYKKAFDDTIKEFLVRYCNRQNNLMNFDYNRAYQLCLDYLVEECTAMCLWKELECNFEIYPSRRNLAMVETHRRFIAPLYTDLLHAVSLKMKRKHEPRSQQNNSYQWVPNLPRAVSITTVVG